MIKTAYERNCMVFGPHGTTASGERWRELSKTGCLHARYPLPVAALSRPTPHRLLYVFRGSRMVGVHESSSKQIKSKMTEKSSITQTCTRYSCVKLPQDIALKVVSEQCHRIGVMPYFPISSHEELNIPSVQTRLPRRTLFAQPD